MIVETHYPLAYFYNDVMEGECTFELSIDKDNDLIVTISNAIAYHIDLEIELEYILTDLDLELIAREIYEEIFDTKLHEELIQENYNTKLQNAYDNGKNSRREF